MFSPVPSPSPSGSHRTALSGLPALADFKSKTRLLSPVVLVGLVRFADFAIAVGTGIALAVLYVGLDDVVADLLYGTVIAIGALSAVIAFDLLGLYSTRSLSAFPLNLPRLMAGWGAGLAVAGTFIFFIKAGSELSRVWLFAWLLTGALTFAFTRGAVSLALEGMHAAGHLVRRAVIYGAGELTDEIIRAFEAEAGSEIRIAGVFDDRGQGRNGLSPSEDARIGTLDDLIDVARALSVDLVIVSLPLAGESRLHHVASRLSVLAADIRLPALATRIQLSPRLYSQIGPVAMIDLHDRPISDWGTLGKWLFDKTLGFALCLALFPVMLAVAAAIKLETKGPVLFRQRRYGFNNELIEVLKFRSMYLDQCDSDATRLVSKTDPRVTRVGRFIRKTSLDELPQLFNVLKGNLSLVGPRPHAVAAKAQDRLYNDIVARYYARHRVKPGITGWAQIRGWRGETDTEEKIEQRVAHDLYYIDNWSVFFDLYILAMTPIALFKTENAY